MAQTPKVTVRFHILELLDNFIDSATADDIGNTVIDSAKELIASGQSPVRGQGRFEAYKNPRRYPGKLKPARPVNLRLTGQMLDAMAFRIKNPTTLEIGIIGDEKAAEIAGYHNEGTDHMAMRQIIPKDGEEWAVSVMRAIAERYGKRLADLIRMSNKKS